MVELNLTSTVVETYMARTPASRACAERAQHVMPGGDTRAAAHYEPYPLTLSSGAGPLLWDIDGNEYWDLAGNFTSLVHGNAYPPIVAAAEKAIRGGSAWPARNEPQLELAELLCQRIDSIDQVRFCNSGSEAAMVALQAARALTGRRAILMAETGFHGTHEAFAARHRDSVVADPAGTATLTAPYGDAGAFEQILRDHGSRIAAVFLEPVMAHGGIVAGTADFLARVQRAAVAVGAIFVLDEIVTVRLDERGCQGQLNLAPDLTLLGKIIGGGFPIGAIGGRRSAMEVFDPRNARLFHSGTFNGNPVSCAAGVVSVRELTAARIADMAALASVLDEGLCRAARALGLPFSVRRHGSLLNLYMSEAPPRTNAERTDASWISQLHVAGLNNGVFFAPRGMMALSTALTSAAVDEVIERMATTLKDVAEASDCKHSPEDAG